MKVGSIVTELCTISREKTKAISSNVVKLEVSNIGRKLYTE